MNGVVGAIAMNPKKSHLIPQNGKKNTETKRGKLQNAGRTLANPRRSTRERKLALLEDVDNLKKKLRQEENVHRALERAFNRPLGALPRLPPYLPQYTLELLAEVAVLEEEVVRLEEQVVSFRQGIYQEAVCLSSRKNEEDSRPSSEVSLLTSRARMHSRSLSLNEAPLGSPAAWPSRRLSKSATSRKSESSTDGATYCSEVVSGKPPLSKPALALENRFDENKHPSPTKKTWSIDTPKKRCQKTESVKTVDSPKILSRDVEQAQPRSTSFDDGVCNDVKTEANKISEEIVKCLINIFIRLSASKRRKSMGFDTFSSLATRVFDENFESDSQDPYCKSSEFRKRDVGAYKHFHSIEAGSFDHNRKTSASFLIRKLKILFSKLTSVKLDSLNHQEKLAFWINVYNSCVMNAYLEHGIPDNPDMNVTLAQRATINVGGIVLNAFVIDNFILRFPYHLQHSLTKSAKNDDMKAWKTYGLEWSEPLVTFALSSGCWSSPAVRVYTASQIEAELETAKREYLQATIGISSANKLTIPKLLEWHLLDFAKDLDALLDWTCLQLPKDLRDQVLECLDRKEKEPLSRLVQVTPYSFSFRYLIFP